MAAIELPTTNLDADHMATALGGADDTATIASVWTAGGQAFRTGQIVYDNRTALASAGAGGAAKILQSRLQVIIGGGMILADDAGDTVAVDATGVAADPTVIGDANSAWWVTVKVLSGANANQIRYMHQSWLWNLTQLKAAVGTSATSWTDGTVPSISLPT